MMVIQWENPNVSTLQVKFRWLMAMALSLGVTVDIVITVSMCYWLWRIRRSNYEPYVLSHVHWTLLRRSQDEKNGGYAACLVGR
jgi:hypothetical protein